MIIKKYLVDNMKEAMDLIASELGPDATIVSSRKVKKKGLFQPQKLEVVAAYDNYENTRKLSEKALAQTLNYNNDLLHQINEIKQMVQNIKITPPVVQQEAPVQIKRNEIDELLEYYAFSKEVKKRFEQFVTTRGINIAQLSPLILYQFVDAEIQRNAKVNSTIEHKVNFFVGPTGVGKTTTIAKIVSNEIIQNGKKVALITLDTYRIAAAEQLRVYASILDIPLTVCYNPEDFEVALKKYEGYDYIFVDTTGRNNDNLMDLNEYTRTIKSFSTFLVVNPNIKYRDLLLILSKYRVFNYNRLVFTKLDESSIHENILNIVYHIDTPISYLCFGQQVPSDLAPADKDLIMKYIWKRGESSE